MAIKTIETDGSIYYHRGAGSYVYEKDLIPYIASQFRKKKIRISIGAQPNSSPHFGTLEVFSLAFALANMLMEYDTTLNVSVFFEVVDSRMSLETEMF